MLTLAELVDLTKEYGFPKEAQCFFTEVGAIVLENDIVMQQLKLALESIKTCNDDFSIVEPYLDKASKMTGIGRRSLDMLFRLFTVDDALKVYVDKGISEEIANETVSANIIAELEENRRVYGDWGTFVLWFHTRTYQAKLIKLGRLQYEIMDDPDELFCHILSFLPFDMELIQDSLRQAYTFFGFDKKNKPMKVITETWMLHPAFKDLFSEGSNLRKFADLFTVTEYKDTDTELWYIFWNKEGDPIESFPEDTSLQRSCKKYLLSGKTLGEGTGYMYYY